ncbi:transcription regulator [Dichomitus squalens]|uniref:Transcription regulator n=1 Tax=Dichomitus squalens TaxID=114155 RepID=A0A4Q9QE97_9APHY|nr:transcription regulator [Dichomitus squalens]TBU66163.1 transcription regulator [Dichomitus squalens]
MAPTNRKNTGETSEAGEEKKNGKGSWRRPTDTAFQQQRLRASHPLFIPRTVIPTLLVIGVILAPIGGLLIWGNTLVSEIDIDYTHCELLPSTTSNSTPLSFTNLSSSDYSYKLRAVSSDLTVNPPQYAFLDLTGTDGITNATARQCVLQFDVPADIQPPVMLYYKLSNFYQNHRRYVKSASLDQLSGKKPNSKSLSDDCQPLDKIGNQTIYPCGMIANSMFNDTFTSLTMLSGPEPNSTYAWSEKNIAWPGEARKYVTKPAYDPSEIVPPPFWVERFPNGYTADNIPDLKHDEHFQNWMRTAGLPTFSKLWGRNDDAALAQGRYQIVVNLNFPVLKYDGTKSIVISSAAWLGGKNPFLGWAYVAAAGFLLLLGVVVAIVNCVKPRKLGDPSKLSFNR